LRAGSVAQVAEYLLCKYKALSSNEEKKEEKSDLATMSDLKVQNSAGHVGC
jgi:hypothetical protein